MKLVRAVVREERAVEVARGLCDAGATGLTVLKGLGGVEGTAFGVYRKTRYPVMVSMCVIDALAADCDADRMVSIVVQLGRTGSAGDGHVVVMSVDESRAIRTALPDESAAPACDAADAHVDLACKS